MKRITAFVTAMLLGLSLFSCKGDGGEISRDRAIELALDHAGLNKNTAYDIEAELNRDRGSIYWEVDFEDGHYEYSYDINKETGEVKKVERDRD